VAFAAVLALVAALLFGLAPIVHAKKTDLHGALKDGSPRMTGNKARLRVRRALVIGEVALAVVLVIGCTVMVRSFVKLQRVDLGFSPDRVLTFGVELPVKTYPGTTGDTFWNRLEDRVRALPGVKAAATISGMIPARPLNANDIGFVGKTQQPDGPQFNVDYWQVIGDGGFEALGARILRGRGITAADTVDSPHVVVVNESFANRFYPGEDAIGKRVILTKLQDGTLPEQTIVGIVADLKNAGIDQPAGTEVFVPNAQYAALGQPMQSNLTNYVVVRTEGDPKDLIPAVHRAVAELDPSLPLFQVSTMDDLMWEAVARPRFLTFLLTSFAAIALLLAAVGIYGVMAHTVAQRTHEIGLRVALGARPSQVRSMVLRQAAVLVAGGVAIGLGVAVVLDVALGRSLHGLLYGGELTQPWLLGGVSAAVAVAALVATWIPVRRATRVEPTVALRSE
jgi:putative ABC transport system permease protein